MSKKTLAALTTAAMLTPGIAKSAPLETIKDDTNKNTVELFLENQDKPLAEKTISFAEAQALSKEAQLKDLQNQINKLTEEDRKAIIKDVLEKEFNKKAVVKDLQEEYGQEYITNLLDAITKTIIEDISRYGKIDINGEFVPNEKEIKKLIKKTFSTDKALEYVALGVLAVLSIIAFINAINVEKNRV